MSRTDRDMPKQGRPGRHLSMLDAWGLALGSAVGWGAFVMPASTFISSAGPVGALVATAIGTLAILVIAVNFAYMTCRCDGLGSAYEFVKRTFGHDHAFLCAWALGLAYVAIMWANASSAVYISRYLLGPVFQVGWCYQVAGYDVYLGEMAVTLVILLGFGALSCCQPKLVTRLNTCAAVLFFGGVLALFVLVVLASPPDSSTLSPAFPPHVSPIMGIFDVVVLAPWAYVGFESITNSSEEFSFAKPRLLGTIIAAVVSGMLIYMATTVISVTCIPDQFDGWLSYFSSLGSQEGLRALPVFLAVQDTMGSAGLAMLVVVVLAAITTSLLGLYRATGLLVLNLANDGLLPHRFGERGANGTPQNAIRLIMLVSLAAPLAGRAAIGWIVDVTSISASIAYLYVSLCCQAAAQDDGNRVAKWTGTAGIALSVVFFVVPLIPSFWSVSALAPESYLILAAWAMVGLLLFWAGLRVDETSRLGRSTVVWIALLTLVLFATTMWVRRATGLAAENVVMELGEYGDRQFASHGIALAPGEELLEEQFITQRLEQFRSLLLNTSVLQMAIVAFGMVVLFNIYQLMGRRQAKLDAQRLAAEETSKAKSEFLSSVSHDLRTPMNAIMGYAKLAEREGATADELRGYLGKIDSAGTFLLALVNDVLDMSRIESGRFELEPTDVNLQATIEQVETLFANQMSNSGLAFTVDAASVRHPWVHADGRRLDSIVLNLVGNALKFTRRGGSVSVRLEEVGDLHKGVAIYRLTVSDTGIGMSPEFLEHLFEPFERERSETVSGIQGTGLGMAITKSVVDLMEGSIEVQSALDEGTTFVVTLPLEVTTEPATSASQTDEAAEVDLEGRRVLLVDDNAINREVVSMLLEDLGLEVETAETGRQALEAVRQAPARHFDVVLMDVQMPEMNGYEATRAIRALEDPDRASVPIVALTANAFEEDVRAAREAGMDAHLAKPLDLDRAYAVFVELLSRS